MRSSVDLPGAVAAHQRDRLARRERRGRRRAAIAGPSSSSSHDADRRAAAAPARVGRPDAPRRGRQGVSTPLRRQRRARAACARASLTRGRAVGRRPASANRRATGGCSSGAAAPRRANAARRRRRTRRAPSRSASTRSAARQAALEPVLGEHDRRPPLLVEPPQHAEQLVAGDGVELRGRLVEQQQRAGGRRARRRARRAAARRRTARASERSSSGAIPSASAASSTPRATAAAPPAAVLERERELGAHGAHHDLRLGVLEQRAGDRGELGRPVLARVEPADARAGRRTSPPWKCGTRPAAARSSVDLPEPEPPASTTNSPGSTRSVDVAQRRRGRVRDSA